VKTRATLWCLLKHTFELISAGPVCLGEKVRLKGFVMSRCVRVVRGAAAVAAVAALAACGGQGDSPSSGDVSGTVIGTAETSLGTVLTGAKGLTLYMFGSDTSSVSNCNAGDGCSKLWPPATGAPSLASGMATLPGKLGTLIRADGATQVTYQGHPLYTYSKDSKPRETNGENVQNLWHVVKTDTPVLVDKTTSDPGEGVYGY
jgi:predicted lipoprotein with Yx(FWY)xxD motif